VRPWRHPNGPPGLRLRPRGGSCYNDVGEDALSEETWAAVEVEAAGVTVGWLAARGCRVGPSDAALLEELHREAAAAAAGAEDPERVERKGLVRDMLRHGAYKPTGRGKPASEYLLRAALESAFPVVNNLVDINNLVSVSTLLPISVVDLGRAGSSRFRVRRGREGEEYAFNPSGQVLSLRDLLLAAALPGDTPCATPIKDSQATKTHGGTVEAMGLVYAPSALAREAEAAAGRMAGLIRRFAGAEVRHGIAAAE